jgi:anti-sigma B factor antagonist
VPTISVAFMPPSQQNLMMNSFPTSPTSTTTAPTRTKLTRVLAPTGRFDAHVAPAFRQQVEDCLRDGDINVMVDLAAVTFIDSTALAELVAAQRNLLTNDGSLTLHRPPVSVRVILEVTKLVSIFTITD